MKVSKQIILTFALSFLLLRLSAQEHKYPDRMLCVVSPTDIYITYWSESELIPVDTTIIEVVYDTRYRRETVSGNYYEMFTVLQTGVEKQKYYSMIRQFRDDIKIGLMQQFKDLPKMPGIGVTHQYTEEDRRIEKEAGVDWINSEVWVDRQTLILKERAHDYSVSNLSVEYEERVPEIRWEVTQQVDTICGYTCFAATASFRGRDWTVWYAPAIPVGAGPWKLNGLPGLVLRAMDSLKDFMWECRSIEQKKEPIYYYKVDTRSLSREKWHRYHRQVHESPLDMLGENGNCALYVQGERVTPEDNWQVPYNPIELE